MDGSKRERGGIGGWAERKRGDYGDLIIAGGIVEWASMFVNCWLFVSIFSAWEFIENTVISIASVGCKMYILQREK